MREEIAHCDVSPVGAAPFGDMSGDGIVERQHAALDLLHHDRCGRDDLGKRREIEDGVVRGRSGVDVECGPAERLSPEDLARGSDLDDGARKGALSDGLVEHAPGGDEADRRSRIPGPRQDPSNAPRPMAER